MTNMKSGSAAGEHYNDLTECIQMCDRMLLTHFPAADHHKQQHGGGVVSGGGVDEQPLHPSRTIVVQNFCAEAEVHVRSFASLFGIVEVCELFRDLDLPSALALVQYKFRRSAADALLAMAACQVRGSSLVANFLWNGPYDQLGSITCGVERSFRECVEKRVVCVGRLPRSVTERAMRTKCERFGRVERVRVQPREQGGAFAYVVFATPRAAALATYCLRNSTNTNAALMLGYSENGSPVLLGPIRVRPLEHYHVPLTSFDVRCICTRFLDYNRLSHLFLQHHHQQQHRFHRPGSLDHCLRIHSAQVKGVWFFLEVLLFEGGERREVSEMAYQLCNHKYLYRFTVDLGLHKPVLTHDEPRPPSSTTPHFLRWNSFFVLDLQISIPIIGQSAEPRLEPRLHGMNHVAGDVIHQQEEAWFGLPLRHALHSQPKEGHVTRVRGLLATGQPIVRLVGSSDQVNGFQLPVHVYSDAHTK